MLAAAKHQAVDAGAVGITPEAVLEARDAIAKENLARAAVAGVSAVGVVDTRVEERTAVVLGVLAIREALLRISSRTLGLCSAALLSALARRSGFCLTLPGAIDLAATRRHEGEHQHPDPFHTGTMHTGIAPVQSYRSRTLETPNSGQEALESRRTPCFYVTT